MYDIAIVGLGPVGGVLAALLGQAGISTLVMDKAEDLFPLPRAIGFDHEIMRVMQDIGLAEAIAPFVVPYAPTEYLGVGGRRIARYASLPPPYPQGWEPSFVFAQPPFERAIRARLAELPAVEVRLSTELTELVEHDDHVELRVAGAAGEGESLRARYAVGCDGGGSFVRRRLAIGFESLDFDEPWLVVDVLVDQDRLDCLPQTIVQYCDPERPTTFVIGPDNHRRWEFMLLPGENPEEMRQPDVIWRLLDRWLKPDEATLWRAAPYVFHALVAEHWRKGRVFLAGDAAHMTPPFMAQGMCQGIRDAANLAWKLGLVLSGAAGDELLDSYEAERKPHVEATTRTAKALGRIICERDPDAARARDARMLAEAGDPPAVRHRQSLIPGLGRGALCHEQGAPVGTCAPQPLVATAQGPRRLDDLAGHGFRLVLAEGLALEAVPARLWETLRALGGVAVCLEPEGLSRPIGQDLVAIVETEGVLGDWFSSHGLAAALVRPDHYVCAIARTGADLDAMVEHVSRRLAVPALMDAAH